LVAQLTLQPGQTRRLSVANLWRAARGFSLPVSVLPVVVATAAVLPWTAWRWDVLAACVLGVAALHMAGNMFNDYFDFRKGVDRRIHGDEMRPGRVLVRGGLLPRDILVEAAMCMTLGAAAAAYVVWRSGPELLWFAVPAAAAIYAYTGPPLVLKYRAMGEPVIFIVFGPLLLVGSAWAQTGRFEMAALMLSVPVGLATTAVLVGNNFRDREEDAAAGIRTIGTLAGGWPARIVYVVVVLGSVHGLMVMGLSGRGPLGLVLAPAALALLHRPLGTIWRGERLADIDAQTARFETLVLVLVIVSYLVQPPTTI
jgi:1,4-dihydroxy-2-naphthoate octaprenyltransferase